MLICEYSRHTKYYTTIYLYIHISSSVFSTNCTHTHTLHTFIVSPVLLFITLPMMMMFFLLQQQQQQNRPPLTSYNIIIIEVNSCETHRCVDAQLKMEWIEVLPRIVNLHRITIEIWHVRVRIVVFVSQLHETRNHFRSHHRKIKFPFFLFVQKI